VQFESQIENLHEWACSRSFGLGTKIPWDERFLVESLSDSTIYMAYYTVAHFLHGGSLNGTEGMETNDGTSSLLLNITPEQMTMAAWNYIFLGIEPSSAECSIPRASLDKMRAEFEYWYPLNVRVSGKDLINNHLTFFLFTHEAIWGDKYFPKSIKCNGHLKLNNAKMSKSDGVCVCVYMCIVRLYLSFSLFLTPCMCVCV
jgi:leucyl-tRNA synthetase